jgi:hypothetical protein
MWNNLYPSCTPKFLQEFPFMWRGRGSQVAGCSPFVNSNHSQDTCCRVDMCSTAAIQEVYLQLPRQPYFAASGMDNGISSPGKDFSLQHHIQNGRASQPTDNGDLSAAVQKVTTSRWQLVGNEHVSLSSLSLSNPMTSRYSSIPSTIWSHDTNNP